MKRRVPDISKIKKIIGFEPNYKLDSIIKMTIDYFRKKNKNKCKK